MSSLSPPQPPPTLPLPRNHNEKNNREEEPLLLLEIASRSASAIRDSSAGNYRSHHLSSERWRDGEVLKFDNLNITQTSTTTSLSPSISNSDAIPTSTSYDSSLLRIRSKVEKVYENLRLEMRDTIEGSGDSYRDDFDDDDDDEYDGNDNSTDSDTTAVTSTSTSQHSKFPPASPLFTQMLMPTPIPSSQSQSQIRSQLFFNPTQIFTSKMHSRVQTWRPLSLTAIKQVGDVIRVASKFIITMVVGDVCARNCSRSDRGSGSGSGNSEMTMPNLISTAHSIVDESVDIVSLELTGRITEILTRESEPGSVFSGDGGVLEGVREKRFRRFERMVKIATAGALLPSSSPSSTSSSSSSEVSSSLPEQITSTILSSLGTWYMETHGANQSISREADANALVEAHWKSAATRVCDNIVSAIEISMLCRVPGLVDERLGRFAEEGEGGGGLMRVQRVDSGTSTSNVNVNGDSHLMPMNTNANATPDHSKTRKRSAAELRASQLRLKDPHKYSTCIAVFEYALHSQVNIGYIEWLGTTGSTCAYTNPQRNGRLKIMVNRMRQGEVEGLTDELKMKSDRSRSSSRSRSSGGKKRLGMTGCKDSDWVGIDVGNKRSFEISGFVILNSAGEAVVEKESRWVLQGLADDKVTWVSIATTQTEGGGGCYSCCSKDGKEVLPVKQLRWIWDNGGEGGGEAEVGEEEKCCISYIEIFGVLYKR